MKKVKKSITKFYRSDDYIAKNPSLHEEDSPWKVSKIIPLIDTFLANYTVKNKKLIILDVGSGAGIILKELAQYIKATYDITVEKYVLDLSPGMIEKQILLNPDITKALNKDIRKTALADKEVDLVLMIDVLEHVPQPWIALEEIQRISHYSIFKVPLEDNLSYNTWNFLTAGKARKAVIKHIGHINAYNMRKLTQQVEQYLGKIVSSSFTNVFEYTNRSAYYKQKIGLIQKVVDMVAEQTFKVSPKLCASLFADFAMLLVKSEK